MLPTITQIRQRSLQVFGVRPCLWQVKVVQAILQGKNTISIAGTGMGKTLTFWLPLLFKPVGSVQIVVTPLNILGKQNVKSLEKVGLKGIFISAENATMENFRVRRLLSPLRYLLIIFTLGNRSPSISSCYYQSRTSCEGRRAFRHYFKKSELYEQRHQYNL